MIVHPPWRARYTLTPEQARALIHEQFPQLLRADDASFELLGSGWDNDVWLVEGRYSFRFPRRHLALALLEHERLILPKLLPQLSLAGPMPRFLGEPSAQFPYLFTGYDYLEGVTCGRVNPDEQARAGHAAALGRFLGELHAASLELGIEAPLDGFGRADVVKRAAWYREQLVALVCKGLLEPVMAQAIPLLVEVGISVQAGALTTMGASAFLLFARFLLFYQFGVFMLSTIAFSLITANFTFTALLALWGPSGVMGDLRYARAWLWKRSHAGELITSISTKLSRGGSPRPKVQRSATSTWRMEWLESSPGFVSIPFRNAGSSKRRR